ncbi:hypothetical protein BCR39DRAFT_514004 [Naematelia encephala]|uniref:UspA domain-containing protein n=1 Tax=Naematelia encephala TaxID=71784 RepID=A0A1Y2BIS4_9TREE|nr:hypothetical protein BCR39DRAFT_514004 [Naematelia encephala]
MSLRPSFRRFGSSPTHSYADSAATSSSTLVVPQAQTPSSGISPLPSAATSHVSIQLPERPSLGQPTHSAMAKSNSNHGEGGHESFRRTRTNSSGQYAGDGRYRRKVGFEAFDAGPAALFAYTCAAKSEGYKRSRSTRVFAVAVSADESGETALDWLMSELVEDGDEIVAIRVIDIDDAERKDESNQDEFREDAHRLLTNILDKNNEAEDRRVSVVVEFVAGRVTEMLLKMIALYRPDSLVVGTKGTRSRLQTWGKAFGAPGMGSVSRFAVSHSPVPVIVVRPERKVKKTLAKRQNDPKRGQYAAIVGPDGMALSRSRSRGSVSGVSDRE